MHLAARILVGLIAVEHVWFMVLETFLWRTGFGRRTFGNSVELAEATWRLAANQGVYNGFLAAGLAWSLFVGEPHLAFVLRLFFLGCVLVAGLVGGVTAKRSIFFIQALPALIALTLVLEAQ